MAVRICLGKRADGTNGLWITKPGISAVSPSPDNSESFIFDSRWQDVERIVEIGKVTNSSYGASHPIAASIGVLGVFLIIDNSNNRIVRLDPWYPDPEANTPFFLINGTGANKTIQNWSIYPKFLYILFAQY